jgi:hypothetical protein
MAVGMAVLILVATGCAPAGDPPAENAGLSLSYEDVAAPQIFAREGVAIVDAPDGAEGLWAVTPGLPRPERGLVENAATGASVEVALFAGRAGPGGDIRLSRAAAEAIGLTAAGRVRVTALRRELRIARP